MDDKVSIRGRTARKMVKFANHFPFLGAKGGEVRAKLNEREKMWECPEHLEYQVLDMGMFSMELLKTKQTEQFGNLSVEDTESLYGLKKGIIMQLHGGGYYGKLHNTYRNMAALYHEVSTGLDVLSVDYRVAPEYPYPAALEDAVCAYEWILEQGYPQEKVFVAGDSAGGGLALALCLYLRDYGYELPRGIITMSAWTDLTKSGESYKENFDVDPVFGKTMDSLVYKDGYYKGMNPEIPYISPVNGDYSGFPPILMQVGEYEMLLSDTMTVAEKAREAGVIVREHIYSGMFHVFQMGLLLYPESKNAWVEVGRFIRHLLKNKTELKK